MQNVVASRIKPQLVRKRTRISVPPTIKIITKATQTPRVVDLQRFRDEIAHKNSAPPPRPRAQRAPADAAVSRRKKTVRKTSKKRGAQYKFREAPPESLAKIREIRGKGRHKILIIIGNGPSISEVPLGIFKNIDKIDTLSINKPDPRIWPTSYWAFFDVSQMRRHEALHNNYNGYIFNSTAIKKQKAKSMMFKNIGGQGFSKDLVKGIHIGRSSVYASMQIALWMEYEHVYIFGCDMNPAGINGKLHFYGNNPDVEPTIRANRFKKEAEYYTKAVKVLTESERKRFTFCSEYNPWEFVNDYCSLSHKSAPDIILEHVRSL